MKRIVLESITFLLLAPRARAQNNPTPQMPSNPTENVTALRLETMSKLLMDTQRQLEQTQQQLNQMRSEIEELRAHAPVVSAVTLPSASASALAEQVTRQQEEQEILQAEVKQHEQTKLESVSKYPVRVYGLLLANLYSNAGVVDDPDLPSIALSRPPDQSHGSIGASFRQTLLGVTAEGPHIFGAASAADLSVDFFGGPSYNYYGSTNGSVRLRRADIHLAWGSTLDAGGSHDELHLSVDAPLISPLSPTSFATLAQSPLAWSGNLWTWAPQLQYKHAMRLSRAYPGRTLQLEGGLWDPPVIGLNQATASRMLSAGELSRRPAFLGRASVHGSDRENTTVFGVGGYSDRQSFYKGLKIQMWAVTADWQLPLARRFIMTGELYRGRGLGGLGGGAYKDTLTGTDRITGLGRTLGLNAAGGWAQLKARLFHGTETNLIFGQDNAFAHDFRQLDLAASTYPLEQSARNQVVVMNFIYRPRTYLILSPEYRRIASWQITGLPKAANIYTLSLGYQF